GSLVSKARIWDETDPIQALAQEGLNPTRVFRLTAASPGAADLGARQGPFGSAAPPVKIASSAVEPRPERPPLNPSPAAPAPPTASVEPPAPMPANAPGAAIRPAEMPEMPVMPPTGRDNPPPRENPPAERAPAAEVAR